MPDHKKDKKNKMLAFKLNEISAVDRPAQGGAIMSIMKRDNVMKNAKLTTEVDGHQHGIDFYGYECGDTHGSTTYQDEHSHPWLINQLGELVVGVVNGHTHSLGEREIELFKSIAVNGDRDKIAKDKGDSMSGAENKVADLEKRLEKSQALLEKANLVSKMSDVEKSFMSGLDGDVAEGFLKMSSVERSAEIEKSKSSDPVIYKSADGTEYHKSDESAANLAKRVDASEAKVAKMAKASEDAVFEKRAGDELSHATGSIESRAAIIKALDGVDGAPEFIKSANDAAKAAQEESGSSEGSSGDENDGDAYGKYQSEVTKVAKDKSISKSEAEDIVQSNSPELYAAAVEAG